MWLHETTAAFELLFCPLAVLGIGCFSSRADIIFFFFSKGSYRISKSLFCLCQSNLSLLITVVCHLAVFNVWGVFSSNTPVGNWGHGEKEQLVQDHTAGNWQQGTEARSQAVFAEQGWQELQLSSKAPWIWLSKIIWFWFSAFLLFSWEIFFLMLPSPSGFWRGYCLVHSWSLTQKTQCSFLHYCQLSICL